VYIIRNIHCPSCLWPDASNTVDYSWPKAAFIGQLMLVAALNAFQQGQ